MKHLNAKQRRMALQKSKTQRALSRKPGRTYAEAWSSKRRLNGEPDSRMWALLGPSCLTDWKLVLEWFKNIK